MGKEMRKAAVTANNIPKKHQTNKQSNKNQSCRCSGAGETRGARLVTVIKHKAKINRQIKVNPQDVSLDRSAETDRCFKVNQSFEQRAARDDRWFSYFGLDQIKHVGAHS